MSAPLTKRERLRRALGRQPVDRLPVQTNHTGVMGAKLAAYPRLYREFGQRLSFYGGLSTQEVLPRVSPAEVRAATLASIRELAPEGTGLLLGPSHRMQSDIPIENVVAMLETFRDKP